MLSMATAIMIPAAISGCLVHSGPEVVVYTALDREFSEPIFEEFTRETGIRVLPKYDTESTKTLGLTNAILAEKKRPRCDVFWNNEILNTLRLERAGRLRPYRSPLALEYPAEVRSPENLWYGFAARARVCIVNTDKVSADQFPTSILELANAKWKNQVGIAKPLFGTTASHAAVLFAHWGDERAIEFFRGVKKNAQVLSGNKQVALAVARGQLAWGITDTDDAIVEVEDARPVKIVFPDQGENGMGTLLIPNTISLIRGSPNQQAAEKFLDYVLSAKVESRLANGRSAQIPLNKNVSEKSRATAGVDIRPMAVSFQAAVKCWDSAARFMQEEFVRAD